MATPGHHCPFLNRADPRCSEHFRLDDLSHAFKFCFGRHKACVTYLQLRVERKMRQLDLNAQEKRSEINGQRVQVSIPSRKTRATR